MSRASAKSTSNVAGAEEAVRDFDHHRDRAAVEARPSGAGCSAGATRRCLEQGLDRILVPKIDLRKKQLAGVELFARCRHPQSGILSPNAFMPGATDAELLAISELALVNALKIGNNFSTTLGISLRFAVNIP